MQDPLPELAALRKCAQNADLSKEAREVTMHCVNQMPQLYADLLKTQECRHAETITILAQATLKRLRDGGSGAGKLAEVLVSQLATLHERLGISPLRLQIALPPPVVSKRRKKVVENPV